MDGDARRERREEAAEGEAADEKEEGERRAGAVDAGGMLAMSAAADGWWTPLLTAEFGLMGSAALEPEHEHGRYSEIKSVRQRHPRPGSARSVTWRLRCRTCASQSDLETVHDATIPMRPRTLIHQSRRMCSSSNSRIDAGGFVRIQDSQGCRPSAVSSQRQRSADSLRDNGQRSGDAGNLFCLLRAYSQVSLLAARGSFTAFAQFC